MQLAWDEIQTRAATFAKRWQNGAKEKQEAQSFIREFLQVFDVDSAIINTGFESDVKIDGHDKYIDFLWAGQIAIEMKSRGADLKLAFKQLQNYMNHLENEQDVPDLWLVCDFENIKINRRSTKENWSFKTKDLRRHVRKFANIAGYGAVEVYNSIEVNVKAAEKMAKLHDALLKHGYEGYDLELYLVRLLFCLFADDTGIFPQDSLRNYIENSKIDGSDLSERIGKLFEILNLSDEIRAKRTLLNDELKQNFRYINGGLFERLLPSAEFDESMRKTLLECTNFDWNTISPAIFGAMFQGVMDKNQRRELGAHYTSEENILKLINPLFMDELRSEFERVKIAPAALEKFHEKLAGLRFLDPACGCGNFLIVTYRELRLLELKILKMKRINSQQIVDVSSLLKVSITQFYGIEYEDFPCQIAQVGMWLVDHQMNLQVSDEFGIYFARLPLKQSATIVHDNALRLNWAEIIEPSKLNFILGNPPFVGARIMSEIQKSDILNVFGNKFKGVGNLDYVTAWYFKASEFIKNTNIRCAFVSTNSITQGEQVALLWKPLMEKGIHINFGVQTFKWSNEAKGKAAVHCVIVGFSLIETEKDLNPYLIKAPNIFVESRSKTLFDVPPMRKGNQLTDGLNFVIEEKDYANFIAREPNAKKYIKRLIGAEEFINNKLRYCLWLKDCTPSELRKMPLVLERVERVRKWRLASKDEATRRIAGTPTLYREMNNPDNFIVVPSTSSEKRDYIPIGFLDGATISTNANLIIPNATLYHFAILTSSVHMAWTRAVCGRLKSDYRYSKDIVYNNFVWCDVTDEQRLSIESLAQKILDVRAKYINESLADLYDNRTMPQDLLKAHQALDKAVMKLYGFGAKTSEAEVVAGLMEMYRGFVGEM